MPRLLPGTELGNNLLLVRTTSLSKPLLLGFLIVITVVVLVLGLTWNAAAVGSRYRALILLTLGFGLAAIFPAWDRLYCP